MRRSTLRSRTRPCAPGWPTWAWSPSAARRMCCRARSAWKPKLCAASRRTPGSSSNEVSCGVALETRLRRFFVNLGRPFDLAGVGTADQREQRAAAFADVAKAAIDADRHVNRVERLQHDLLLSGVGHERNGPRADQRHEHFLRLVRVQRGAVTG